MSTGEIGAICFGVVIGWIVYRTLRRTSDAVRLSDLATVVGAVGGAGVTALFNSQALFGCYAIGLAGGFFAYLILGNTLFRNTAWLGTGD
jgi:NhaP-type Na+/H+ or K+/H+ antiporter